MPLDKIMFSIVQVNKDAGEGMLETFHLQAHYLWKLFSSGLQSETP